MDSSINVVTAPNTTTFQMRINPEIKKIVEDIYARQGLSLTDAINVFLQQSINVGGLPFLVSPENAKYMKAWKQFSVEVQKGFDSAERGGWLTMDEVEATLGRDRSAV